MKLEIGGESYSALEGLFCPVVNIDNDLIGKDLYDSGSATLKHSIRCLKMAWACYSDSTREGVPNASGGQASCEKV